MARLCSIKRLHGQRGVVTILFALVLMVLVGLIALAVDLTRLHLVKAELQNAADAAALAGAGSLIDTSLQTFNWSAATDKAQEFADVNSTDGKTIGQHRQEQNVNVAIQPGYWNLITPSFNSNTGLVTHTGDGNIPAVQVTITLSHLKFFFAPILGIPEGTVHATAIAAVSPPTGGTGLFPMAIGGCLFNLFWDSVNNTPKLNPATGQPYEVEVYSVYSGGAGASCNSGQWTSFQTDANDVPFIRDLIKNGNSIPLSIGDSIWIQPGTKTTIYGSVPTNVDVAVPVVDNVGATHSHQTVIAIAGFHITGVVKHGNKSVVKGHFIPQSMVSNLHPGNGTGTPYGAYTPPFLVK
ncbi:MAG: TadG family pilus assembly protein [Chlorobaculum sp.]